MNYHPQQPQHYQPYQAPGPSHQPTRPHGPPPHSQHRPTGPLQRPPPPPNHPRTPAPVNPADEANRRETLTRIYSGAWATPVPDQPNA